MKTIYNPDFPKDLLPSIKPLVTKWKGLLPSWCAVLRIKFDPRRDAVMSVKPSYRNRWAVLFVTGQWYEEDLDDRELALIHEFIHILLDPLDAPITRILSDVLEEKSPASELAESMFYDGLEAAVTDISQGIFRMRTSVAPERSH